MNKLKQVFLWSVYPSFCFDNKHVMSIMWSMAKTVFAYFHNSNKRYVRQNIVEYSKNLNF